MLKMLTLRIAEKMLNQLVGADFYLRNSLNALAPAKINISIEAPIMGLQLLLDDNRLHLAPISTFDGASVNNNFDSHGRPLATIPEVTVTVPNLASLIKLFLDEDPGIGQYRVQGEVHLLQKLKRAFIKAKPDISLKLEPWIGSVAAHQVQELLIKAKNEAFRLSQATDRYVDEVLKDDLNILPTKWEIDEQMLSLQNLQTRIERLQARLDQIEQKRTQSEE